MTSDYNPFIRIEKFYLKGVCLHLIRVLLVVGSLRIGGLETVVMNCAKCMSTHNCRFDFLLWDNSVGELEKEAEALGGKIIKISPPNKNYFSFYKSVKEVIKKHGPYDVVHSHVFFNTGIVLCAAHSAGVNVRVAHSHSVQRKKDKKFPKNIYCGIMRRMINKHSTVKCACSTATGRYLFGAKAFDACGIVLPNVVDMPSFAFSSANRETIRKEFNIPSNKTVIGHIGHMLPVKNQLFLLEIFAEYLKTNEATLLFVGNGPEYDRIKQKISELGIEDDVILTGTRMDACKIMSAFDIFMLPSLHEGLPLTTIEAMSNGLSYVIEKNVVAEEIAKFDNCIKVDGYDKKDWCRAISEGLVKGRYDSEDCIEKLELFSEEHFRNILTKIYTKS